MATFDVSTIAGYIQENKFDLIGRAVIQTGLAENMTIKPGLQGNSVRIPLLSSTFTPSEKGCSWNGGTGSVINAVDMDLYHAEVQKEFCVNELRDTMLAEKLRAGAQSGTEALPDEEVFANYFISNIKKYNEKHIIQGSGSTSSNFGLQAQLVTAESGAYAPVVSAGDAKKWVAGTAGTGEINALDGAMEMFAAMPFEIAMASDQILVVNPSDYKALVAAMVKANLYHYTGSVDSLTIPGTNIKVVATSGIAQETDGANFRFLTTSSNLILGCDLVSDAENFEVWYSKDNRQVRAAMDWTIGQAVVQPNLVVTENAN